MTKNGSPVRHFSDLDVWRVSHQLFLEILRDVDGFPRDRGASIVADQVIRSTGSVGANLAEGFNRSKKKYLNSLEISLGESAETENWLYKIRDAGYLDAETANLRIQKCIRGSKMLSGLKRSISRQE